MPVRTVAVTVLTALTPLAAPVDAQTAAATRVAQLVAVAGRKATVV